MKQNNESLRDEAVLPHVRVVRLRAISRVRPNLAPRVALVENLGKPRPVVSRGAGDHEAADEPATKLLV
jgi:hypothetical protein